MEEEEEKKKKKKKKKKGEEEEEEEEKRYWIGDSNLDGVIIVCLFLSLLFFKRKLLVPP